MTTRQNVSSQSPWEEIVGYSRAVRVGTTVHVSGTTATDTNGKVIGGDNVYLQSKYILEKIDIALREAGAKLSDVVRTRIYVTNIDHWDEVARAHKECFGDVRPGATMVEVSRLISAYTLVEIEAEAICEK